MALLQLAVWAVGMWNRHHPAVYIPYLTAGTGWTFVFDAVTFGLVLGIGSYMLVLRLFRRPSF